MFLRGDKPLECLSGATSDSWCEHPPARKREEKWRGRGEEGCYVTLWQYVNINNTCKHHQKKTRTSTDWLTSCLKHNRKEKKNWCSRQWSHVLNSSWIKLVHISNHSQENRHSPEVFPLCSFAQLKRFPHFEVHDLYKLQPSPHITNNHCIGYNKYKNKIIK